jgi:N,N'-diacetylchitobiose transport system permease protein
VSSQAGIEIAPTPVPAAAPLRRRRRKPRKLLARLAYNLLGLLVLVVMVFPVYWMVSTAFKPGVDILRYEPKWVPAPATLDHFRDAIAVPNFWDSFRNSLVVVGVVVALSLVVGFLAALALAKFRLYGRGAFIVVLIGVQMVPLNALIIPLYILGARVDRIDTLSGVIAVYVALVIPFTVWTLSGFLLGIPKELEEAAMVDGSSRFGAFVRILLPLTAPGLVATAMFAFIQAWNEFLVAYVFLTSDEKQTITVWLAGFTGSARGTDFGALMAASTLTAIPVIVFFLLIQRRIAFGLTAGAVRG